MRPARSFPEGSGGHACGHVLKLKPGSQVGPNILLNQSKHVAKMAMWQDIRCLLEPASELENVTLAGSPPAEGFEVLADALSSISAGFQLAMAAGPLCGESMTGVAIVVEEVPMT